MEAERSMAHEALEPDEQLLVSTRAGSAVVLVTNRRIIVGDDLRVALAIPLPAVRRVEFDIEKSRPATLVIVPESPTHAAQVLRVEPADYESTAAALVALGKHLAEL